MEILTSKRLRKMDACVGAIESFEKIFGTKAKIENIVTRLHNPGLHDKYSEDYKHWGGWLLSQNLGLTKAFLDAGVDVHAGDNYAIRLAACNGHTEVVKLLLNAGADVHADSDYAIRWAAERGHVEVVKLLLNAGADVHARNDFALRLAAKYGHTEVVRLLKEKF